MAKIRKLRPRRMHPMHTAQVMTEVLSRGRKKTPHDHLAVEYITQKLTIPDVVGYLEEGLSRGYAVVTMPWGKKARLVALREFNLTDLVKKPRTSKLSK